MWLLTKLRSLLGVLSSGTHFSIRDGGAYFEFGGRVLQASARALTFRGSGDICKIIIICIFCLKLGVITMG